MLIVLTCLTFDTMHEKAVRYLIYAQVSFFGCLLAAVFITTAGFRDNHGLSFYGVNYPSIIPFGLGLVLCTLFLLKAAAELPVRNHPFDKLQPLLRIIALLLFAILITPDTLGVWFYYVHVATASLLFSLELLVAIWLAWKWNSNIFTWTLLAVQFVAGVVALLSQAHVIRYLSQSSLIFQLVFAVLLVWSISQLIGHAKESQYSSKKQVAVSTK